MSSALLPTNTFIVVGLAVVLPLVLWKTRRGRASHWTTLVRLAFAVYLVVIVGLVFTPFPIPPWTPFTEAEAVLASEYRPWPFPWVNLTPFDTIRGALRFGVEWQPGRYVLGNVLAFAPFGIFVPLLWPRLRTLLGMVALAVAISLAIESVQIGLSLLMGFPYRVADIDDVVLNVLGVSIGYVAYRTVVTVLPGDRSLQPVP